LRESWLERKENTDSINHTVFWSRPFIAPLANPFPPSSRGRLVDNHPRDGRNIHTLIHAISCITSNKLKEASMSAPIVVNPNREGRFILQTDASTGTELAAGGMGAVLLQEQKDNMERVVAYASRGLKDHKVNYPAFLLEKAAACWGIDYFDT
jgi:hypothetical protein